MQLVPIQFRPGMVSDTTAYTNKGGWVDGNLVRFRMGQPETIGGWDKVLRREFLGTCRSLHVWFNLNNDRRLAVGTHRKYYIEYGGALYDITPIRKTVTLTGAFAADDGSIMLTVTEIGHGAVVGAFVTFSGADGLGGDITADVLNREHEIASIIDPNTYVIELPVAAAAADTGDGGATITAEYQVNPGSNSQVGGNGWGADFWGDGGWGSPASSNIDQQLRIWAQDNYGEDLIYNVVNGRIFYWTNSIGLTNRGVQLSDIPGADPETPVVATQVLVSDRDRHVIAFGANPLFGGPAQDPMLIRFSSQENPLLWTPSPTNTAGDLRLGSGSKIIRALETKREILVWTDAALYSMQFIGPPFTFGIQKISDSTSLLGFNAATQGEDTTYWMGRGAFFVYSGQVQELPCSVKSHVFGDFNFGQTDKVYAGTNREFSEVIWFYPSKNSNENDRYVIFNYRDNAWYFGKLTRTAWIDCCPEPYPVAAGADNALYYHDFGTNDGSQVPPAPLNAYIESSPLELDAGNNFMMVRRVLPDVTFMGVEANNQTGAEPTLTMRLISQDFPGGNFRKTETAPVTREAVVPVEQYTDQVHVRLRTRSVRLRVESDTTHVKWQLGTPRLDVRPDGRR